MSAWIMQRILLHSLSKKEVDIIYIYLYIFATVSTSKSVCGLVCVGVEEKTQLQTELLPKTVDNLLLLARHIHNVTITMGISKVN